MSNSNETLKPLPIGESDLASILDDNCIYIDKTKHIYDLVRLRGKYFLSRPRRFGKSTLISTFHEIFRGNRELFKDQWIYNSDYKWDEYPIIRIDFNNAQTTDVVAYIIEKLTHIIINYSIEDKIDLTLPYDIVFNNIIIELHKKYQRQVVVLIDEYDKPILDVIEDVALAEKNQDILTGLYVTMKGVDEYLRFVFLTGIHRLGYIRGFHGLNNLHDISMVEKYATICGITQSELEYHFSDYIDQLANHQELTREECLDEIKRWYNGFYFSENLSPSLSVYNPFSTLLLFDKNKFTNYWFASGSPTFLIKLIKKQEDIDLLELDNIELQIFGFDSFEIDNLNLIAIMYQAGYLTLKDYDKTTQIYTLGYTNYEIEKSFKESLLAGYGKYPDVASSVIAKLLRALRNSTCEDMVKHLKQYFTNLTYDININKESTFQNIIYIIFDVLGFYAKIEYKTHRGRIDLALFGRDNNIYIFEFKRNKTAIDAISQIHDKGYYKKYQNSGKNIYLIGMNYNTSLREIDDYIIEKL
jgi:hypothetical protein